MATLTINKKSPNIGALLAAEYVQGSAAITVIQGEVNLLRPNKETSFSTTSSICRYFARLAPALNLYGQTSLERTEVDHWLEFSARLGCSTEFSDAVTYLNQVLEPSTYLVGHAITIADMAVWAALRGSGDWQRMLSTKQAPANVERYYAFLAAQPAFVNAAKAAPAADAAAAPVQQQTKQTENVKKERKEEGKFIELPGAEMGKVVVRFPPEASGYLHIGHAKAALLNQYYQVNFKGKLIMRFDDTNPAKESSEFEQVILEDIKQLGLEPDIFTHTSDHFDTLLTYCERMIREGKAYVDDTDGETMKAEREQRAESVNRNNDVEKNLAMWEEMKAATDHGKTCAVRAKIDMKSDNGCMRDPTIYRCKAEEHVRTGIKYKVYPTYDFACPIVDSIEGVTHALRTTEYLDRDDQFYWFIDALGLRRPYIWSYARLNLQNTVMSKRKLAWCVAEKIVDGWDDPRFPTVRGVMRRGMTVEGLKQFVIAQGSSRSVVMMDWDKIWSFNKKVIDPIVPRYTALLKDDVVLVKVKGAKEEVKDQQKHPKDESIGMKKVWYGPSVYIEGADAETLQVGETVTFINWGNLRIRNIIKDGDDKVSCVEADLDLANQDYKKTLKLTWLTQTEKASFIPAICVNFDNIISKAVLAKEDDFKSFINRDSKSEQVMLGDPELANLKKGDMIQLQRRGYYICDSPYEPTSRYTGRESPVVLFYIPDGHTKEKPKAGSKHKEPSEGKAASAKEKAQNKKGKAAEKSPQNEQPPTPVSGGKRDAAAINQEITQQGDKIRQLKSEKAAKAAIEPEVKTLLALKGEFKAATGLDWKPGVAVPASQPPAAASPAAAASGDAAAINAKITEQGDTIRKLKAEKAAKNVIEPEVKKLLALKAEFKSATGIDWKPGVAIPAANAAAPAPAPAPAPTSGGTGDAAAINQKIVEQGDKIRKLKGEKAGKNVIDPEVKTLLALKADFKTATGKDWKPGMEVPQSAPSAAAAAVPSAPSGDAAAINQKIFEQGDKIRKLKSQKADKATVEPQVKLLLSLKAEYKAATGQDWKLGCVPPASAKETKKSQSPEPASKMADSTGAQELKGKIDAQGNKVRELKSVGGDKAAVDEAVQALLALKLQYKELTGEDLAGGARPKKEKNKPANKGGKEQQNQKVAAAKDDGSREVKKVTRLGMEAKKEENHAEWYSQVITKAEMIEYYDVSGCYVLRPWAFGIWEAISTWFDAKIKEIGFQNCYFPIFVSNAALQKEKEHIEDFAPEVAWVTRSGDTTLAEPIAVRPTSETVMYPAYAKWVQSHRDLPIKLNQWCNVVRWEFKHPQPFLRTREFLWQEGHSAYATLEEAEHEVHHIIDLYEEIYETQLAIPVVKGKKTQKEKFAGGDYTTTVEAYISSTGRGIQAATSHHLGQNFSKMFDISFEHPETKERCYAYQNSWAITTRSIGVIVMVHGDNKGLILPPKIALYQAVIVPCGITANLSDSEKAAIISKCEELEKLLKAAKIRVKGDYRDNYSPGWKFNHWELKGVPVRIELGARDMAANQFVAVRRDTGSKTTLSLNGADKSVQDLLDTTQQAMFDKAKKELDENLVTRFDMESFCVALNEKKVIYSPFCGDIPCEEKIKKVSAQDAVVEEGAPAMGAKGLCIPFKQPAEITSDMKCICPGCPNKPKYFTLFGRSY